MEQMSETKLELVSQKVDTMETQNNKDHAAILKELDNLSEKMDEVAKNFPTRFEYENNRSRITAVENILKGVGMTGLIAILGALLKLIIIQ